MIDTHAHLYLCKKDIDSLVSEASKAGITYIINVAVDLDSSKKVLATAKKYPETKPTIGIHPLYEDNYKEYLKIEALLQKEKLFCAIGEIGLDYKYDIDKDKQIEIFKKQLNLARKHSLPVIVHNRYAEKDMAAILEEFRDVDVVMHCFSSDWDFVKEILRPNLKLSFTGMITYSKKGKIISVLKKITLDNIMLETDCPYMSPKVCQNNENSPANLVEVAKKIAEVKECSLEEVKEKTSMNSKAFFKLE